MAETQSSTHYLGKNPTTNKKLVLSNIKHQYVKIAVRFIAGDPDIDIDQESAFTAAPSVGVSSVFVDQKYNTEITSVQVPLSAIGLENQYYTYTYSELDARSDRIVLDFDYTLSSTATFAEPIVWVIYY